MKNQTAVQLKEDIVFEAVLRRKNFEFHTTWGLFSPKHIDKASYLLSHNMTVEKTDDILDIGCGYGALGLALAADAAEGTTHMIDANVGAVAYAKKNAEVNGVGNAEVYESFGLANVPAEAKFDVVVSNLPANVGREMLFILLSDARDHMKPGASIYVVTIAGLREFIKTNFNKVFGNYKKVAQEKGYVVARATLE